MLLAFLQFTIVLDFMILSPLGAMLLEKLNLSTSQFGIVVSAYAFSAGAAGIAFAGFADRFDRKVVLLVFYAGFLAGTLLCGVAPNYEILLVGRVAAGLFGGVIGSISLAIVADLFPLEQRGRVMGVVQTAFAASQVLGIPVGLLLSNEFGWHAPFLMITAVGVAVGAVFAFRLKPLRGHLTRGKPENAFGHLRKTLSVGRYLRGFSATLFLATGGYMLMPFGTAFLVNNLGLALDQLPTLYVATGVAALFAGPLLGRLSDQIGKYPVFLVATAIGAGLVVFYTNLTSASFALVVALNVALFATITGRIVSSSALISAVPTQSDRGAYMAINSSLQQLAGGVGSALAGLIVHQGVGGKLEHYELLGYIVVAAMAITAWLMHAVHRMVRDHGVSAGGASTAGGSVQK